ncbi:hypothetical protein LshimejAT787_0606390 [Lyophyllum shimeji]|uniref:Uncharacterized protein n=1 Tax=Lyophyllum shimeji TaxID=47721 RepID=A0A9P3UNM4_LYOSH|nr:hypothetical protein LshimejAT787_0606390 [Lyophyllum shimeji]
MPRSIRTSPPLIRLAAVNSTSCYDPPQFVSWTPILPEYHCFKPNTTLDQPSFRRLIDYRPARVQQWTLLEASHLILYPHPVE